VPVARDQEAASVRLAELVALLSLGTDLGLGQPMEHMIRACLVSLRLAERLQLPEAERRVLYYAGLLAWVGCHTDAYEQAKWLGDDLTVKRDAHYSYDFGRARDAATFVLKHVGAGKPLMERVRVGIAFLGDGRRALEGLAQNHYRATDELAARLGLGDDVRASLRQSFERWDGKGAFGVRGKKILMSSRLINLADVVEVFRRTGGVEAAVAVAKQRSGTHFDPALVTLFCEEAAELFGDIDSVTSWDAVIAAEPALSPRVSGGRLDDALEAIGAFAEMKSPWRLGHAQGVTELAVRAAAGYGLPDGEVTLLRRAASIHDLGGLGVSNSIWDKRGALTRSEVERVRMHPYLCERMLAFSPALARIGALAAQHHERMDGSGYPKGLAGDAIAPAARLLAAADVYHAMTELRPHRPARTPDEAAAALSAEVSAGRIDGAAAAAVLRASGHRASKRREWPAGLTTREVEVLRLLARGLTTKEIAARLDITPKTAANHLEHIYVKIDANNRATATLFAMRHRLMSDS
jgi:HD-GYP domain-containing protein (c-di-GMP phosphodiesterase class II)